MALRRRSHPPSTPISHPRPAPARPDRRACSNAPPARRSPPPVRATLKRLAPPHDEARARRAQRFRQRPPPRPSRHFGAAPWVSTTSSTMKHRYHRPAARPPRTRPGCRPDAVAPHPVQDRCLCHDCPRGPSNRSCRQLTLRQHPSRHTPTAGSPSSFRKNVRGSATGVGAEPPTTDWFRSARPRRRAPARHPSGSPSQAPADRRGPRAGSWPRACPAARSARPVPRRAGGSRRVA
jgi:hypothetical protein